MEISVKRIWTAPASNGFLATVTGTLYIDGQQTCFTLENQDVMIPMGTFPVKLLWSERFQRKTPHIDVPGRTEIEIHGGNVATDSEGCILVAEHRIDEYHIYEAEPATSAIEEALEAAEANGETNTVTIS